MLEGYNHILDLDTDKDILSLPSSRGHSHITVILKNIPTFEVNRNLQYYILYSFWNNELIRFLNKLIEFIHYFWYKMRSHVMFRKNETGFIEQFVWEHWMKSQKCCTRKMTSASCWLWRKMNEVGAVYIQQCWAKMKRLYGYWRKIFLIH